MDKLAQQFAELADKFGPSVVEAAKGAARAEAYSQLASGALCLIIASALIASAVYVWRHRKGWDEMGVTLVMGFTIVIGGLLSVIGAWSFVDPWTWITINHPELWIAKHVLHL